MRELAQLLLGPLAGGDVLVHEGDAAHRAVLGEHRRGGEADLDKVPSLRIRLVSIAGTISPAQARDRSRAPDPSCPEEPS